MCSGNVVKMLLKVKRINIYLNCFILPSPNLYTMWGVHLVFLFMDSHVLHISLFIGVYPAPDSTQRLRLNPQITRQLILRYTG